MELSMTNFEFITSKSADELAEWLDKCDVFEDTPWMRWFDDNYCSKCQPEFAKYVDSDTDMEFSWCELYGKCMFFKDIDKIPSSKDIIRLWLENEYCDPI